MLSTVSSPTPTGSSSASAAASSTAPILVGGLPYDLVSGIGQTVISTTTIIGAMYLLISLLKQGRGKLRVRLLLGMIVCDLALGIVAFGSNVYVLSGGTLINGSSSCNWHGFIITGILFCQHLYTLMTAVATFLLLRYPLSSVTSRLERHSWAVAPVIFFISFVHSGGWWARYGWSSTGVLCYYRSHLFANGLDARDLVQFIPRAFVFIVILILYSMLFKFLRRPDSIQLSSQFVSGDNAQPGDSGVPAIDWMKRKLSLAQSGRKGGGGRKSVDPNAPWEQLEFVQIGGTRRINTNPTSGESHSHPVMFTPTQSILNGDFLPSRRPSHLALAMASSTSPSPLTPSPMPMETPEPSSVKGRQSVSSSQTGMTDPLITPMYEHLPQRPSEATTLVATTPELRYSYPGYGNGNPLSPVLSQTEGKLASSDKDKDSRISLSLDDGMGMDMDMSGIIDMSKVDGGSGGVSSGGAGEVPEQTLAEYLQETAFDGAHGNGTTPTGIDAERGLGSSGTPQLSATAYFNRQASLLMLYFPLAYMAVFALSLVRLLYDMVHNDVNPVLSMISSWFVLSVGLIDAIVYGIAEVVVKRKVRRKMGDRL